MNKMRFTEVYILEEVDVAMCNNHIYSTRGLRLGLKALSQSPRAR